LKAVSKRPAEALLAIFSVIISLAILMIMGKADDALLLGSAPADNVEQATLAGDNE
jgi:hypothetical protein